MANALNRNVSAETRMNLASLQRVDPYIKTIVTSATQVALYKFEKTEWKKTETEGTLFVYERKSDPQYGFLVLNRLSSKNSVEPVTKELDFQLRTPFLLYKTKEDLIFGIWFCVPEECERVAKVIQDLVKETEEKMKERENAPGKTDLNKIFGKGPKEQKPTSKSPKSKEGSEKLMKMLNVKRSPQQSSNSKQESQSPPIITNSINGTTSVVTVPSTSQGDSNQNVADFFAKAEQSQHHTRTLFPSPTPGMFPMPFPAPHHPGMPLFPAPLPFLPHPSLVPIMPITSEQHQMTFSHPTMMSQSIPLPRLPGLPGFEQQGDTEGKNPLLAKLMSNPGVHSVENLEREHRFGSKSPQDDAHNDLGDQLRSQLLIGENKSYSAALSSNILPNEDGDEDYSEPQLISPMVFASGGKAASQKAKANASARNIVNGNQQREGNFAPLTPHQLQQAFEHLLRTDSEFINRLHQAYVDSINSKLH